MRVAIRPLKGSKTYSKSAQSRIKRFLDIAVSLLAILFLLPALMVVAVLVKLESPGPILFRQKRTGLHGVCFDIFKFRTMRVMEDGDVVKQAEQGDNRVTKVGAFLRRTSIDELPQLFNILLGQMSIVGPRPHALSHDKLFAEIVVNYSDRFRARPGLTGLAQIRGYRGQIFDDRCISDRVEADVEYIDNWSIKSDVYIVLKTIPLIFGDKKAY